MGWIPTRGCGGLWDKKEYPGRGVWPMVPAGGAWRLRAGWERTAPGIRPSAPPLCSRARPPAWAPAHLAFPRTSGQRAPQHERLAGGRCGPGHLAEFLLQPVGGAAGAPRGTARRAGGGAGRAVAARALRGPVPGRRPSPPRPGPDGDAGPRAARIPRGRARRRQRRRGRLLGVPALEGRGFRAAQAWAPDGCCGAQAPRPPPRPPSPGWRPRRFIRPLA